MRRRPMHLPKKPVSRRCALGAVALASLAFGLTGASADPSPISYTIDGIQGTNGWYRGNQYGNFVVVTWSINIPYINTEGCGPTQVPGPATNASATCRVEQPDESWVTVTTKPLKIDATPPTGVTAALSRGADFNGWFNHPVGVTWTGTDGTSGIASCSSATYSGPDKAAAPVSGGCTDQAGNFAAAPVSINYDGTAPVLSKASVNSRNGSDVVTWKSSSPSDTAVVQRWQRGTKKQPVVFRGAGAGFQDKKVVAGLEYMYAVQTFDQAGNASKRRLVAGLAKIVTMRKLPYVPRVADRPILRWKRVRGAHYYNVQLFRGSKRVYAAWPLTNHLGLPAAWRWSGKKHRLTPGKYRWYVWAGFGARSFARYRTVGSAQFVVPR